MPGFNALTFDEYIARFWKGSLIAGATCLASIVLEPCGGFIAFAVMILWIPLLLAGLALPLLWRRLKGRSVAPESVRWVWLSAAAPFATAALIWLLGTASGSCFR